MCRTEGVVDIEDLQLAWLHGRAALVEQSRGKSLRLGLGRRILQTAHGRLRAKRCARLRTAADRELHQRIMPQPVEVDGILVPAAIAEARAVTISNIACRIRSGSRRSGIASASRRQTPRLRSPCRTSG